MSRDVAILTPHMWHRSGCMRTYLLRGTATCQQVKLGTAQRTPLKLGGLMVAFGNQVILTGLVI